MYQKGIEQGQAGYAAAIGMILLVITLGIALIQRRLLDQDLRRDTMSTQATTSTGVLRPGPPT